MTVLGGCGGGPRAARFNTDSTRRVRRRPESGPLQYSQGKQMYQSPPKIAARRLKKKKAPKNCSQEAVEKRKKNECPPKRKERYYDAIKDFYIYLYAILMTTFYMSKMIF